MHRVLLCLGLLGCVPVQPTPSYGTAPAAEAPATSGLTCMQLFGCFQGCTEGSCYQGCMGQADPTAQAAASAYLSCGAQCQNAGDDCLATRCQAEAEACTGVASAQGAEQVAEAPVVEEQMVEGQPHTTANLLPWMTGQWIGTDHQFEFYGDGRVKRASGVPMYTRRTGEYACVSVVSEIGTVRQEGDLLIMEFAPADASHCGDRSSSAAGLTVRYRISWYKYSTLAPNLRLTDIDCTSGMCSQQLRRR